jgi:hypothetical protein
MVMGLSQTSIVLNTKNTDLSRTVWSHKMKALQARRSLQEALANLAALSYSETDPEVRAIQRQLAIIDLLNPELQQITN